MDSPPLDLIPRLVGSLPFSPGEVARITGVRLDPSAQNPFFAVYRGRGQGAVAAVEVRERTSGKGGGLVVLDLAEGAGVSQAEAMACFGDRPDDLLPPSPHGPAGAPLYLVYRRPWGLLRLGFRPDGPLTTIVLDAT